MRVAFVRIAILVSAVVVVLPGGAAADATPSTFPAVRVLERDLSVELGALRLDAREDPSGAGGALGTASDVLLVATMLHAAAIDSLIVPLAQGEPELALRASVAHSVALGLTLGVGAIFESTGAGPYSLQSGMAFTSAGFSCAMHLSRRLYDDRGADLAACGASLALASAAGILGAIGGRQDAGDVLVGGALGLVVGYLAPLALVPERPRVPAAALSSERDDSEPLRREIGGSISVAPMVSAPKPVLEPEYEEQLRGGSAGAQIGPGTSGAGPSAGLGSAIGVSISGTF